MKKTVLITGASAGIGKATAIYLAQNGYNVYGAARRTEKMKDLIDYGIKPVALDVTSGQSITACVERIFKATGRIDILINNAGFGAEGAIEDISMQDAKYQMEVNVFGAMRLIQIVLPKMRARWRSMVRLRWRKLFENNKGDYETAFKAYNTSFRAYINEVQAKVEKEGLDMLIPRTEEAIHGRNTSGGGF